MSRSTAVGQDATAPQAPDSIALDHLLQCRGTARAGAATAQWLFGPTTSQSLPPGGIPVLARVFEGHSNQLLSSGVKRITSFFPSISAAGRAIAGTDPWSPVSFLHCGRTIHGLPQARLGPGGALRYAPPTLSPQPLRCTSRSRARKPTRPDGPTGVMAKATRSMPQIEIDDLSKTFSVAEREGGFWASVRSVFRRSVRKVEAVDHVSFNVEAGEIVGFLGPNGAGKTTTLKMLAGLLHPTAGTARVMGHVPWHREPDYLRKISMLMGQRSQMHWDLPALDSFLVHGALYDIGKAEYKKTLDELVELLDLGSVLKKQVRTLSLGERMKCEICVSLLHRPDVLFLDEPTIGVDITMQARIRRFIADYNRKHGATIILTSHYMADVTALCRRIIIIDHGHILFDGRPPPLSWCASTSAPAAEPTDRRCPPPGRSPYRRPPAGPADRGCA